MYYWLNKKNSCDNRKNNVGKISIYTKFNAEFVKELPKLLFNDKDY